MRRLLVPLVFGLILCLFFPSVPVAEGAEKHKEKAMGEATDDAALVYFIRTKKFQGKARTFFVYADGTFLGTLDNNCYTYSYLEPGEHLLWLNFAKVTEDVDLKPGEVYYYNVWPAGAQLDFENVGSDWGQALITTVKSYCTPTEKEILKSETHIAERRGKAEVAAAKEPEEHYWASHEKSVGRWPHADISGYSVLFIEEFTLTDPKAFERKKALQVLSAPGRITDMVEREIDETLFTEIRRETPQEPTEGAVILQGEITRYKPGSRATRGLLIGTSNAYFDFAVRLIDSATGDELATFSGDRTWFWGGTMGESVGIQEMEESFVYELSVYLEECKRGRGPEVTAVPMDDGETEQ